ncbi:MAG: fimbrillin family protein [Bacteroidales bacterium]|nr:fimbrillin family protein [Bacteroidales bacterium]
MKKSLIIFAAAALAMTACTTTKDIDYGVAQASKQVSFTSHVNKNTRALVNDNFSQFSVFGAYTTNASTTPVQIFNATVVSKNGADWTYTDEARYWIKDASYTFYAYSKENGTTGTSRFEGKELTLVDYTVDGTPENQKDLVFAAAENVVGKETGNAKVAFDFKHILSKIRFTFTCNFPEGYKVKVDQVEIRNFRDKGTFTASTAAWTNQERSVENENADDMLKMSVAFAADAVTELEPAASVATQDVYVLPFAYEQPNVRLYFRLTITNANEETVSQKVNYGAFKPTWAKGTAYNYNVSLTGAAAGLEKIEFTTDPSMNLDGWATGTDNVEFNFGTEVQNN